MAKLVKSSEMIEGRYYTFGNDLSVYQFRGDSLYYGEGKQDSTPDGMHECCEHGRTRNDSNLWDCGICGALKQPQPPKQMIVGRSYDVMHGNGQWTPMGRYDGLSPNRDNLVRFAGSPRDVDLGGNRWRETEQIEDGEMLYYCTEDAYRMLNWLDDRNIASTDQLNKQLSRTSPAEWETVAEGKRILEARAVKAERELAELKLTRGQRSNTDMPIITERCDRGIQRLPDRPPHHGINITAEPWDGDDT